MNNTRSRLLARTALIVLPLLSTAGCQTMSDSYRSIFPDPGRTAFVPAIAAAPAPPQVTAPAPDSVASAPLAPPALAVPPQTRPYVAPPGFTKADLDPVEATKRANEAARQRPSTGNFINAFQLYDYVPGALYDFVAAKGKATMIAMRPGETINDIAAGDTIRWVIGQSRSGDGKAGQEVVILKPIRGDLQTNFVITTNERIYLLEASSTEGNVYNAAIAWNYPQAELLKHSTETQRAVHEEADTIGPNVRLEDIDDDYDIRSTGHRTPAWLPTRIFTDGAATWIQFPANLGRIDAPVLFVTAGGETKLVNYRAKRNFFIVDKPIARGQLRLGADNDEVVDFTSRHARTE